MNELDAAGRGHPHDPTTSPASQWALGRIADELCELRVLVHILVQRQLGNMTKEEEEEQARTVAALTAALKAKRIEVEAALAATPHP